MRSASTKSILLGIMRKLPKKFPLSEEEKYAFTVRLDGWELDALWITLEEATKK